MNSTSDNTHVLNTLYRTPHRKQNYPKKGEGSMCFEVRLKKHKMETNFYSLFSKKLVSISPLGFYDFILILW